MSRRVLGLLCLLGCAYLVLFHHLGTRPFHMWDESRSAQNAMEMANSGDLLVTRFAGKPDHWNTKPPLLTWMQAGLLGAGLRPETAVRLPSALAALATLLLLVWYCATRVEDGWRTGLLAAFIVISSYGYVGVHVARTGDFDALLSLFVLIYCLAFFEYVESEGRAPWVTLAIFFAGVTAAMLTKSIAGGLALPPLVAYLIVRRRFRATLSDWRFLLGTALSIGIVVSYVALREHADPGYLHAVVFFDLKRVSVQIGKYHYGPGFYVRGFMTRRFIPWVFLAAFAAVIGIRQRNPRTARLALFASIIPLFVLAVISTSETKHAWYDAQTYGLMALVLAIGLAALVRVLVAAGDTDADPPRVRLDRWALDAGLVALFALPLANVITATRDTYWYPEGSVQPQEQYGTFLRFLHQRGVNDIDVSDTGVWVESGENHYTEPLMFYAQYLNARGARIRIDTLQVFHPGDTVASCDPAVVQLLRDRSSTELVKQGACALMRVPLAADAR